MTSTLHCACSARPALTSVQPEPGLDAQGCPNCQGVLLTLARYRAWRAQGAHVAPSAAHAVTADGGARNCPGCTRLMHRYRVGAQPDFRVDRCAACQYIWLDAGEWAALVQAGLAGQLEDILSDGWQRQLQVDDAHTRRDEVLRARHGNECMDELARVRLWLQQQPGREELLSLLRAGW